MIGEPSQCDHRLAGESFSGCAARASDVNVEQVPGLPFSVRFREVENVPRIFVGRAFSVCARGSSRMDCAVLVTQERTQNRRCSASQVTTRQSIQRGKAGSAGRLRYPR
jgi:hypothetical protein